MYRFVLYVEGIPIILATFTQFCSGAILLTFCSHSTLPTKEPLWIPTNHHDKILVGCVGLVAASKIDLWGMCGHMFDISP